MSDETDPSVDHCVTEDLIITVCMQDTPGAAPV